jgi:hypothetical protein
MPFIAPAVGAALIGAAATTAGGVMSAMSAKKQRQQELDRLHPPKTEQQIKNLADLRSRTGAPRDPMANPFVDAVSQGQDRLSVIRDKVAALQAMNQQRMGSQPVSTAAPTNPFMMG